MQKVSSSYTKDVNPIGFLIGSNVLYADKKKTTSLLRTIGFRSPIELNDSGFVSSISYNKQNVKFNGKPFSEVVSEKIICILTETPLEMSCQKGSRISSQNQRFVTKKVTCR